MITLMLIDVEEEDILEAELLVKRELILKLMDSFKIFSQHYPQTLMKDNPIKTMADLLILQDHSLTNMVTDSLMVSLLVNQRLILKFMDS